MSKPQNSRWRYYTHRAVVTLLFAPLTAQASFIESTMGTAVVNDATATYHNPAALTLVKQPQIIALGSVARFNSTFNGQSKQLATGFMQSGQSSSGSNYFLPSLYLALPEHNNITLGFAVISNFFNRDTDENSLLRYVQGSNNIEDVDFIPALGLKLNPYVSLGVGLNFSYAKIILQPTSGFPSLNIPDSQSQNISSGTSFGGDVGILITPNRSTTIGFNYNGAMTYDLHGNSTLNTSPSITSNQYHFKFWTPARNVLSINQFITPKLGIIGTLQYIQWSIIRDLNLYNFATQVGARPTIISNATIHYRLHNAWLYTLGTYYRISSKWIIRAAGTYNQSPGNPSYQISNGDSIILGASAAYQFNKNIIIDGSYAHAFIKDQGIHVTSGTFAINGINSASRDAVSMKLTINV